MSTYINILTYKTNFFFYCLVNDIFLVFWFYQQSILKLQLIINQNKNNLWIIIVEFFIIIRLLHFIGFVFEWNKNFNSFIRWLIFSSLWWWNILYKNFSNCGYIVTCSVKQFFFNIKKRSVLKLFKRNYNLDF